MFGVPGDYVLEFDALVEKSPIEFVGMTREDCAGLAADAYARLRGLGVACVTYCVGGLSLTNAVAGAWAEKSPVLVISGAPGVAERARDPLLHHRVRDFSTQRDIFSHITVAVASLEDPATAYQEVDRVLHAIERYKRPGFIELPRDRVHVARAHRRRLPTLEEMTDANALSECIAEAVGMINSAKRPVILADAEVHRFGLQTALLELAAKTRIPVAATLLGKSVISERHPLYLGIYEGAMGRDEVRRYVESADCLIMLGCFMSDINLGIFTAHLDPRPRHLRHLREAHGPPPPLRERPVPQLLQGAAQGAAAPPRRAEIAGAPAGLGTRPAPGFARDRARALPGGQRIPG